MKRFLSLVNMELHRVLKLYMALLVIISVVQIGSSISNATTYKSVTQEKVDSGRIPLGPEVFDPNSTKQIEQLSTFTGILNDNPWLAFSTIFGISVLVMYVFFIWYRDWFGENQSIYRLLMLPVNRLSLYFAKVCTMFLLGMGFVAAQIILSSIVIKIYEAIVPANLYVGGLGIVSLREMGLLPTTPYQIPYPMFFYYFIGFGLVCVVSTSILLERSYKWKGILFGMGYVVCAAGFPLYYVFEVLRSSNIFYTNEFIGVLIALCLWLTLVSATTSNWLLRKKITV